MVFVHDKRVGFLCVVLLSGSVHKEEEVQCSASKLETEEELLLSSQMGKEMVSGGCTSFRAT
jgi:hypothetical protein